VCCLDQAIDVAGKAMSQAATLLAAPFVSSESYEFANTFFFFLHLARNLLFLCTLTFEETASYFPTAFQLFISAVTAAFSDV